MSGTLAERPGSVTAVVFLTWLAAIVDLVGGAVLVFFSSAEEIQAATGSSETAIRTAGWVTLAIGILVALVAIRLGEGSSGARMLVTILMLARVGSGIYLLVTTGAHGGTEAIVTIVLSAGVLYLLWTGAGAAYFEDARR